MKRLRIEIETLSNLFIGGLPTTFEIGGIDQYTIENFEGQPIIPASSLKGVLRRIVRDMTEEEQDCKAIAIGQAYKKYLSLLQEKNREQSLGLKIETERLDKMNCRFEEAKKNASAEYLFGIQGFNQVPKLIFNDLKIKTPVPDWYSMDSKNSIELKGDDVCSNPRFYKTVRPGILFHGDILFHDLEKLEIDGIGEFVEKAVLKFNEGIYRLGNSGSRGYGRVEVKAGCD